MEYRMAILSSWATPHLRLCLLLLAGHVGGTLSALRLGEYWHAVRGEEGEGVGGERRGEWMRQWREVRYGSNIIIARTR